MPSKKSSGSKKGSPGKKSPSKKSPSKSKSPKHDLDKKGNLTDAPAEEEELVVPVPEGVMHRRMRFLLETKLKTDVEFIVGPDNAQTTISAHKCMLAAESPIFEKLFVDCEEWKANQIKEREEEARKIREEEREKEVAIEAAAAQKKSPDKKDKSGSPNKKSPSKQSPKKKSPKAGDSNKSPKSSPKKSPKSKSGGKSGSPKKSSPSKGGKSSPKGGRSSPSSQAKPVQDFCKDTVIGSDTIRIQDVHPLGFYRLLRYIYFDEMVFTGVVGTIRTLYAARKYCFYDLARACVNYLENNVCIEHVLKLLKASFDFGEPRLRNLCMRLIINDTFEVLKRPEFKDTHRDVVVQILKQDVLNIREIELFDQVMHWAENECERIGIAVTAMNQRIALGNHNFALIRFPTILPHEFATHVVESGSLKTEEIISILQYYITGRKPNVPYSCKTRRRPCLDLSPLDNASVAFSEQTDVTFVVYTDNLRRAHSFRDIYIPEGLLPPVKTGLIRERERTGSPPGRFHLTEDEYAQVHTNLRHLARLYSEREHFEFSKQHMALMRTHYN